MSARNDKQDSALLTVLPILGVLQAADNGGAQCSKWLQQARAAAAAAAARDAGGLLGSALPTRSGQRPHRLLTGARPTGIIEGAPAAFINSLDDFNTVF